MREAEMAIERLDASRWGGERSLDADFVTLNGAVH
jgi:hypothetical protein